MASVCAACRDSKVKCELLERSDSGTQRCARCVRIGLVCEPALPSQRGKHSSRARLGGQNKRRLESAHKDAVAAIGERALTDGAATAVGERALTCTTKEAGEGNRFVTFWRGLVSGPGVASNSRYLAIQLAGRARRYNRPDLMANAMALCAHYGYYVEDVVSRSQALGPTPAPSTIEEYPAPMAAMLRASSGYACGRLVAGGVATSVTNASFESAVMSRHELEAAAADPAMPCCDVFGFGRSAYVHKEDVDTYQDRRVEPRS